MGDKTLDGFRQMRCSNCGREWLAMCYVASKRLECPSCGYLEMVKSEHKKNSNIFWNVIRNIFNKF